MPISMDLLSAFTAPLTAKFVALDKTGLSQCDKPSGATSNGARTIPVYGSYKSAEAPAAQLNVAVIDFHNHISKDDRYFLTKNTSVRSSPVPRNWSRR